MLLSYIDARWRHAFAQLQTPDIILFGHKYGCIYCCRSYMTTPPSNSLVEVYYYPPSKPAISVLLSRRREEAWDQAFEKIATWADKSSALLHFLSFGSFNKTCQTGPVTELIGLAV